MSVGAEKRNVSSLTLLGLLLLAAGIAGLLATWGVFGDSVAQGDLVPSGIVEFIQDNGGWFWWAVGGVALLLALLGLGLLAAQVSSNSVRSVDLTEDERLGTTTMSSSALTDAVQDEVEAWPGVTSCSAKVLTVKRKDVLRVRVQTADEADVADIRRRLAQETVPNVRSALEGVKAPEVRVELEPQPSEHARDLA